MRKLRARGQGIADRDKRHSWRPEQRNGSCERQQRGISYGAKQALIAPTCRACGEAYANAINYLIRSAEHRVVINPDIFLFWTARSEAPSIVPLISDPQPEDVRRLIESCKSGQKTEVEPEAFYALSLSASASRVVVRDWLDTTVRAVQRNLAKYGSVYRPWRTRTAVSADSTECMLLQHRCMSNPTNKW